MRTILLRLALAAAVGLAVAGLVAQIDKQSAAGEKKSTCYSNMRILRISVAAFERENGMLPGFVRGQDGRPKRLRSQDDGLIVKRQLCEPVDSDGVPGPRVLGRALLKEIPENPYTGSDVILVPPAGLDPIAVAATSTAGWVYLPEGGRDKRGPLPAGLIFPCGKGQPSKTGFEIEDSQQWR